MEQVYRLTYSDLCCGTAEEVYDSLDDLILGGWDYGDVKIDSLEECGHWTRAVNTTYRLWNIELYELAEHLEEWGVDTLDSDRFIVYTNGEYEPVMLKILERK